MKGKGGQLMGFKRRWQRGMVLECLLLALGAGALLHLAGATPWWAISGALAALGIALLVYRPWGLGMASVVAHIDARLPEADHSSGLLIQAPENISGLSRLQRHRVEARLAPKLAKLGPPHRLRYSMPLALGLLLLGLAIQHFGFMDRGGPTGPAAPGQLFFEPLDSTPPKTGAPRLERTSISVVPPGYTGLPRQTNAGPNIRAVEGSTVTWTLEFGGTPIGVRMDWMGEIHPLRGQGGTFSLQLPVERSGFYSFSFEDAQGKGYSSALHSLEAVPDAPPKIAMEGLDTYSQFEAADNKALELLPSFSDDFGLVDAYIVATVSKGSGESIKFREERLRFGGNFPKGSKSTTQRRILDLDQLGMDPGDELYFHIVALDNKWPDPQLARSETYFAQIRDSLDDPFAVDGGMGVDLMPQYFRSQRQLIIDTERLIAEKPGIPRQAFNARSNELGFDQKSLRLKYGQFMGDESETQAPPGGVVQGADGESQDDHGQAGDDPLDGFRHDHDNENEQQLLPEHAPGEGEDGETADPLKEYLHNHDDPEESTLFERSLKEKLRAALDIMWDAELHLRLYAPEKSLPYQYRALELLQDIKNSARIYVHRIGFDPPPIKEDRRLSGDLTGVGNFDKTQQIEYRPSFAEARAAAARLERLAQGAKTRPEDRELFHRAGNELAEKAVDRPLEYLKVLQAIRDLDREENRTAGNYARTLGLLLGAISLPEDNPGRKSGLDNKIDRLYLKALSDE